MIASIRESVEQCAIQFSQLRAAHRTFKDSLDDDINLENCADAEQVRVALTHLKETYNYEATVETIDTALISANKAVDQFRSGLLAGLNQIPTSQLRATLPEFVQAHRRECLALLDLLLSNPDEIAQRIQTIEYLITLLSTDDDGRQKTVTIDPIQLTPRLTEVCLDLEAHLNIDTVDVTLKIHQAAAEIRDAPEPLVIARELRDRKLDIGPSILVPDLLRAIVSYNVNLANSMRGRFDDACKEDLDLLDPESLFRFPMDEPNEFRRDGRELTADDSAETHLTPSFDTAPGIEQVRDSLRRRLRKLPIFDTEADSIAISFDLRLLSPMETESILCEEPDQFQKLVSDTVLLGFLLQTLPTCEACLDAIGLSPKLLQDEWLVEIDDEIRKIVNSEINAGRYERSRAIADLKGRFLFSALSSRNRGRARLNALEQEDPADQHRGVTPEVADPTFGDLQAKFLSSPTPAINRVPAKADIEEQNKGTHAVEPKKRVADHGGSSDRMNVNGPVPSARQRSTNNRTFVVHHAPTKRRILPWVASVALILIGLNVARAHKTSEIQTLSETELAAASSYLRSAYRDGKGIGRLVIGQVNESYLALPIEKQIEAARDVALSFTSEGAVEIMVYDPDRKLVIHYVDGKLRSPIAEKKRR